MKKIYIILFLLLLLIQAGFVFAGDTITWEDSAPFLKTFVSDGVVKDTSITLAPITGMISNDLPIDNTSIGGYDWTWPYQTIELGAVEDIDVRTIDGQDLYLITDPLRPVVTGVSGKVFIYNPVEKRTTWDYTGSELVLPVDAFEFYDAGQNRILVTDRGSHKVFQIGRETQTIDWVYGDPNGLEGNGANQLSNPADAVKIPELPQVIIADRGNNRIIIVDKATNSILWELGSDVLGSPVDVEYRESDASILITDQGHNRVILVSRETKEILWQYPQADLINDPVYGLVNPVDADIIENGHVLIADAGHNRVVEVDPNSDYFWELKVALNGLKDVDQIGSGSPDAEKLLVVARNDAAQKILPVRIGFKSSWKESQVYVLTRDVVFDSLYWTADLNFQENTSLELQFRSAADEAGLAREKWYGPAGDTLSNYKTSGAKLAALHTGHRVYQYRAYFQTSSPKDIPLLKNVTVKYHYYSTDVNVTPKPYFWATNIGIAESDSMIPKWKEFDYTLNLPSDVLKRDAVQILFRIIENKSPFKTLYEFTSGIENNINTLNLENIPVLWGVTSINLNAYPSTKNSSVTPELMSWQVVYEKIMATNSSLKFVNKEGKKTFAYLATSHYVSEDEQMDEVNVILDDNNLEQTRQYYELPVKALISNDEEILPLVTKQTYFQNNAGMPIVIRDHFTAGNDTLEVADRDTLYIEYTDVNDTQDFSRDSVLVVQATNGVLSIENSKGQTMPQVVFGEDLYFRVTGEQDKNLHPLKQDSLKISLKNSVLDREDVYLYELPNQDQVYNTGNFLSAKGLKVQNNKDGIVVNDGVLQSAWGGSIQAEYVDNITLTRSVLIPSEPNVFIDLGGEPYIVEVAPNPYNAKNATTFNMRVASAAGSLRIRKVEIYNIAGEKVREIDASELNFDTGITVPKERYGVVNNWWDLTNDSGQQVSSGMYWIKVHADLYQDDTNESKQIAIFRKFMVIR